MSFDIGQQLGPYKIERQLGKGGMATVYKAHHATMNRDVAIKVLHLGFKEDDTFLERFRREAQIVGGLDHPNIVPIFDFADVGDQPYLVMKYIEGDTLKQYLRRHKELPLTEILRIMEAVAGALDYAHQRGILHRDVKPSNIMIDKEARPYLTDFGLARITTVGESTLSRDMMLGTPQYISPEQAQGNRELDARTDVYSLGIVLYELVVGRVPFTGDTPYAIIHNHIFTPLPPPSEMNPTVPPLLEAVLTKALAKDPRERYASAGDMLKAFRDAILREDVSEMSAAAYRPEAFAAYAELSATPNFPVTGIPGTTGSTPSPALPTGGMWVSSTQKKTARQRFFGRNLWGVFGCLITVCSCLGAVMIAINATNTANEMAVDPVFLDRTQINATFALTQNALPVPPDDSTSATNPRDGVSSPLNRRVVFRSLAEGIVNKVTLEQAQEFNQANPNDPLGYFMLGFLHLQNGEDVEAARLFNVGAGLENVPPEVAEEVITMLVDNGYNALAMNLYFSIFGDYAPDPAVRDEVGEYLHTLASQQNTENLVIFCNLLATHPESTYLKALLGLSVMSNSERLATPFWPEACPRLVRYPIGTLLQLDSEEILSPEIAYIQLSFYERSLQIRKVQVIEEQLLAAQDTPQWILDALNE